MASKSRPIPLWKRPFPPRSEVIVGENVGIWSVETLGGWVPMGPKHVVVVVVVGGWWLVVVVVVVVSCSCGCCCLASLSSSKPLVV